VPDVEEFEAHRRHLSAVAYRMLGTRTDAEDAVQEAWLRYASRDTGAINDLRGWLTTVTARICLDVLRSARARRESYPGQWLPEPIVERLPAEAVDPAERAVRADEVSVALLVVLETLNPEQRVAFVLHEAFAMPYDRIADVLGTSPANARQLASRARRAVAQGERRHTADLAEQRRVLDAFLAAMAGGDLDALVKLLAPEVVAIGDGGGLAAAGKHPIVGDLQVARFLAGLYRQAAKRRSTVSWVMTNGDLGLLVEAAPDSDWADIRVVMSFAITDGQITGIFDQLNPAKLTTLS
jgi:RNA polymerase sigma-70 factor (ECF subfamily)